MRRRTMGVRGGIPLPYDAEIEYLGNDGYAFINTGYAPQGLDIRIACKFYYGGYYRSVSSYPSLVWAYVNDATRCYRLMMRGSTNTLVVQNARRGNSTMQNNYDLVVGSTYEVDFDHYNYSINGVEYTHTQYDTSTENTSLLRFMDVDNTLTLKFYYFKLWKANNLILDFIPVRIGQVGYMYDKVSGQLFGNSGTGSFILGPDKQ